MNKESERREHRAPQKSQRKARFNEDAPASSLFFLGVLCGISVPSVFLLFSQMLRLG